MISLTPCALCEPLLPYIVSIQDKPLGACEQLFDGEAAMMLWERMQTLPVCQTTMFGMCLTLLYFVFN